MKNNHLLDLDSRSKSNISLELNFGDSYLVAKNSIFKIIRQAVLDQGFVFTTDVSSSYQALPLSQLDHLLLDKKIPYYDNVSVLKEIEERIPGSTVLDDVIDNLRRNYIFHESCHAVASVEAKKLFLQSEPQDSQIARLMLEESFANACELLGIVDVDDAAHRLFYEINSYIFEYEDRVHLKRLIQEIGKVASLQYLMFCYIHSNFLFDRLDDKQMNSILKILGATASKLRNPDSNLLKNLRALSKIAFELNPRFRMVTSGFYLRLKGLKVQGKDLKSIGFMDLYQKDPRYLQLIENLTNRFA